MGDYSQIKMDQETFKLKWDSYSGSIHEVVSNLLKTGDFSDVTLVCDDQFRFKAHKFVLKTCSPIFMNMLEEMDSSKTVIYLRGINPVVLKLILEFIYFGEASMGQGLMEEFLKVGKDLQVKQIEGEDYNTFKSSKSPQHNQEFTSEGNDVSESDVEENINYGYESFLEIKDTEINNIGHTDNENGSEQEHTPEMKVTSLDGFKGNVNDAMESENIEKESHKTSLNNEVSSPFQCQQCGEVYFKKSLLFKHARHKHQDMKYFCTECDYQTTKVWSMKMHKEGVHEGVKYPCNRCEYKSTRQSSLMIHIDSVHEGIKYPCNKCEYKASTQSYLNEHINAIHKGRKFYCKHCDFKTPWRNHLRTHTKSKHLNTVRSKI